MACIVWHMATYSLMRSDRNCAVVAVFLAVTCTPAVARPGAPPKTTFPPEAGRLAVAAGPSALGIPPGPVLAWAERQTCSGNTPALLLRWTPAENALSTYTVKRLDGGYTAEVDSSVDGFAHLVTQGLMYEHSYDFKIEARNNFNSTPSNVVTVYVVDEECLGAGSPQEKPGPFIAWLEPAYCLDGSLAVEVRWSASAGATSYTLERFAASGGTGRVVTGLQSTSFLDSQNLAPGVAHAYVLAAQNGVGTRNAQFTLNFLPPPGLCGEAGLPGEFSLTAGTPSCPGSGPMVPINWTASSGADNIYQYRVLGQRGSDAVGSINTDAVGFSYEVTVGVKPEQVHELFMIANDPNDGTKKRLSNSEYVAVPAEVCGGVALAPEVYTQPANGITNDSAVLRSQVRPNGSPTFAYFEWGEETLYSELTSPFAIGTTALFLRWPSKQVQGLECDTDYHYRVVAWNDTGTSVGLDMAFTTGPCPPCGQTNVVLSDIAVASDQTFQACNSITVGPDVSVEATGSLQLTAPLVVFKDGFVVRSGGSLSAGPSP